MFDEIILENSLNRDAIDWQILGVTPWLKDLPWSRIPFKIAFFAKV
jgi:hypothetical protein